MSWLQHCIYFIEKYTLHHFTKIYRKLHLKLFVNRKTGEIKSIQEGVWYVYSEKRQASKIDSKEERWK